MSGVSWERAQETLDSSRMEKVDMMNVISCRVTQIQGLAFLNREARACRSRLQLLQ